GVGRHGRQGRLSPRRRGEAERPRRRPGRQRGERRRERQVRRLATLLVVAALAGCSSWNPFAPDRPAPKELQPIVAPITAAQAWKESIGSVEFPMVPAVNGEVVTFASSDGTVVALDAASG